MERFLNSPRSRQVLERLRVRKTETLNLILYKNTQLQHQLNDLSQKIYECCNDTVDPLEYLREVLRTPGGIWEDESGLMWRVLVGTDDEYGGAGNALIITEQLIDPAMVYHTSVGFTLFQSSVIRTRMIDWFSNSVDVSDLLRSVALDYGFQTDTGVGLDRTQTSGGAGIEVSRGNNSANSVAGAVAMTANATRGFTRPVEGGQPQPFLLSRSEVNQYFENDNAARRATAFTSGVTNSGWWLRSPGNNQAAGSEMRHSIIAGGGAHGGAESALSPGASIRPRPAVWVRP